MVAASDKHLGTLFVRTHFSPSAVVFCRQPVSVALWLQLVITGVACPVSHWHWLGFGRYCIPSCSAEIITLQAPELSQNALLSYAHRRHTCSRPCGTV